MADEFDALIKLLRATSTEAVPAAEDAAAIVYRDAARAAAPRKTGQLAASIKVIEGRPITGTLMGETRKRLFAGPEKKKGYYGYWLEHGWKHPIGPRITYTTKRGDRWNPAGHTYTTGRLRRYTGKAAHSQMGTESFKWIKSKYKGWFEKSQRAADARAMAAAEAAFNAKLAEIDGRIQ